MKKIIRKIIPLDTRLQYHHLKKYFWLLNNKKNPKNRFIIFGSGRSGSTLLTSLLNSNPEIYCDGEVLAKKTVPTVYFPIMYLNALSKKVHNQNATIYGCGLMSTQLKGQRNIEIKSFIDKLYKNNWKFIHIRRKFIVDVVFSLLEAIKDQVWFVKKGENINTGKISVDKEEFISLIKHHINLYRLEDEVLHGKKFFKVVYERDLVDNNNHKKLITNVANFLNVQHHYPYTALTKKAQNKYYERVNNFEEILDILKKNSYEIFINPKYI